MSWGNQKVQRHYGTSFSNLYLWVLHKYLWVLPRIYIRTTEVRYYDIRVTNVQCIIHLTTLLIHLTYSARISAAVHFAATWGAAATSREDALLAWPVHVTTGQSVLWPYGRLSVAKKAVTQTPAAKPRATSCRHGRSVEVVSMSAIY